MNVATEKAGLWKGGGIGTHVGTRFGGPPTGIAMYPANTALVSPTTGEGRVVVTSLYATQRLGPNSSILFGKILPATVVDRDTKVFGAVRTKVSF